MFLSDLSIARPVLAIMITAALVIFGLISYSRIGIEENPDIDFPFMTIMTMYPGADPETVEREVTDRIEDAVATLSGIKNLTSTSAENISLIFIEYELEIDIDVAAQDVRDRMARLQMSLPDGAEVPVVEKFDMDATPILNIAIGGDVPPQDIADYVEDVFTPRIESIEGVGNVSTYGLRNREIRIWLNPDLMASYEISPQQVIGAIQSGHVDIPGGRIETGDREYIVVTSGELESVDEFENLVVSSRHGSLIRLGDVADVVDGLEDQRSIARLNGVPAVGIDVIKQSGANVIEVADSVYEVFDELKAIAPPGLTMSIPRDNSLYTRDNYHEVQGHLYSGALIAVIIVLLFLGSIRTTIIAAISIPTSIVTTYIFIHALGFTLNNVTMLAFTLMVGMLIDDAIVVLENIFRHTEMGKGPLQAAMDGSKEIAFAVLATTLAIVAVFIPVAFMSGIIGRFMYQFGITVAVGVTASYFIAFLLVPMLSSRFMQSSRDNFIIFVLFDRAFEKLEVGYRKLIAAALRRKGWTIFIAFIAMIAALAMFGASQKEFFSIGDMSSTNISIEMPVGTSLQTLSEFIRPIEQACMDLPEVENVLTTLGGGSFGEQNTGSIYLDLTDKTERERTQVEIEDALRSQFENLPGAKIIFGAVSHFGSAHDYVFELKGSDMGQLEETAAAFVDLMNRNPMFRDVDTSTKAGKPEVRVNINRDRAADLGVNVLNLGSTLRLLVSGEDTVATFREGGRQYDIKVRLAENYRNRPEDLENVIVYNKDDDPLEVSSFAGVETTSGVSEINHSDKLRSINVLANITEGYTVGDASDYIEGLFDTMLPQGVNARIGGEAEIMAESFESMGFALLLAIALIYMILAAQFNHFIHPFTIMSSLPLSFVGAFGFLFLSGMTINIFSLIGIIMLMGLVTKNAILVVEFTNQLRDRGMDVTEALLTAGPVRLRPVAMTALSTIGGMAPVALMLGGGAGVEIRAPMAVAVIGGMLASTLLTLVVVPVVYSLFDSATNWFVRKIYRTKQP